jgi:hypothetical protein
MWARIETSLPWNPKVLRLLQLRDGRSSGFVAVCAILWSVRHGTNGVIPSEALPLVHARKGDVARLVEIGFWHPYPEGGYLIHDFDEYQYNSSSLAAKKAADIRWDKERERRAHDAPH